MAQTQHTPGPWAVVEAVGDFFIMPEGESPCIASAPLKGGRNISESRANARLIAAAPDLYEALRELEQAITDLSEQSDDGVLDYVHLIQRGHGMSNRIERARAALAKVTP